MPRGRQRRNRNFPQRAEQFMRAVKKNGSVMVQKRDSREIDVGKKNNRRLVRKKDLDPTNFLRTRLDRYMAEHSIVPSRFVLIKPFEFERGDIQVQEYFDKPSLRSLYYYLYARFMQRPIDMNAEDLRLCKMFMGYSSNKKLDHVKLDLAYAELKKIVSAAMVGPGSIYLGKGVFRGQTPQVAESNVIVLGLTRNGKLRLAIVDV